MLPFSGCPHWALTRCLLGLPRVGQFDMPVESLPFQLATCNDERPVYGRHVVEVHPAVALWLWCREGRSVTASWHYNTASWYYKKDRAVLLELWDILRKVPAVATVLYEVQDIVPKSDDQLDARIAYALGRLWLDDPASVLLLGNADTGAFLVPSVPGIEDAFRSFIAGLPDASTRADRISG